MDGKEIRQRVNEIQERIDFLIGKFVLTKEIEDLMKEREEIQNKCEHNFKEGKCIFCDRLEKKK